VRVSGADRQLGGRWAHEMGKRMFGAGLGEIYLSCWQNRAAAGAMELDDKSSRMMVHVQVSCNHGYRRISATLCRQRGVPLDHAGNRSDVDS
jgi:hypothetical protein